MVAHRQESDQVAAELDIANGGVEKKARYKNEDPVFHHLRGWDIEFGVKVLDSKRIRVGGFACGV